VDVSGSIFANRWEVLDALASGSTSEVYRGRDRETGAAAAIKVMLPEYALQGESLQRFQREARVAQRLAHPRIVEVRDFGVDDGHPWIAMELLEGETLEARLERGRLSLEDAVAIVEQVASAVDHAHAAGVVHRDMKPDNVFLLDGEGLRVKVLDFGFAKILNALEGDGLQTASNALLGTPLYMSPEQIRSSATVDPRSDLWSLAVMAYELLTGTAPFGARATADLLVEILSKSIDAPSTRVATLPKAVDRWARRALERDVDKRFPSATEMARALRASIDPAAARLIAASTAPHAIVAPPRPAPATTSRKGLVVAIGVAIAALLALLINRLRS
jgi:eukaryotic-like serine/threonine-protein kinase